MCSWTFYLHETSSKYNFFLTFQQCVLPALYDLVLLVLCTNYVGLADCTCKLYRVNRP